MKFMKTYTQFIFQKYELAKDKNLVKFYYSLDNKINFVETISFDALKVDWRKVNENLLDLVLFNLHLALGISYYKTHCPKEIVVQSGVLNKKQAGFWDKLYVNGLGEFFYRNKIDFRGLIKFPYENLKSQPVKFSPNNKSLVPIGGGKDSLVTAEILKKNKIDFSLFSLGDSVIQEQTARLVGKSRVIIKRTIDPQLFALNEKGAYNGHVPISAIYSWVAILTAVLANYRNIIFSNEHSANYGNVKYLGRTINHQYSKSLEFEKDLSQYIKENITPSINYFSLLRPLSELKITEIFSHHKKYFKTFSSCNRNFSINKKTDQRWCGECPKCAFVWSQLSAFLPREEAIKIFGKNLYADQKLLNLYLELLGEKNIKPFDCVGTPEEVKLAMYLAEQSGEYNDDYIIKYFGQKILPKIKNIKALNKKVLLSEGKHNVPREFQKIIKLSKIKIYQ